jgi:hypothetical protein
MGGTPDVKRRTDTFLSAEHQTEAVMQFLVMLVKLLMGQDTTSVGATAKKIIKPRKV